MWFEYVKNGHWRNKRKRIYVNIEISRFVISQNREFLIKRTRYGNKNNNNSVIGMCDFCWKVKSYIELIDFSLLT